ncbi:hypothetical protein [uncultured Methylovirgula sp.]|nr:hypothetical protein [uncultured Methylovirgula sp.]
MRSRARARRAESEPSLLVRPEVLLAGTIACMVAFGLLVRAADFLAGH